MRCWLLNLLLLPTVATGVEPVVFQQENVLGTSFELRVLAESDIVAGRAEAAVLAEIDRLAAVFSTYDADSEFSRWLHAGQPATLSPELRAVLADCDRWRTATGGALHPGAERVTRMWQQAERTGTVPTENERQQAAALLTNAPWEWQPDGTVRPAGRYPVSLNAIAKGAIIDAACRRMMSVPGVTGGLVQIGGDLRAVGELTATVTINGPDGSVLPTAVLDEVVIRDRAVATSSGAFRGVMLQDRRWSHLVDPRTGSPVDHIQSATVLAPSAADADALATACSVLTVSESLSLVDSLPDTACLLLDADGRLHRSRRWPTPAVAVAVAEEPPPVWNGGMELEVAFEINQPDAGGRYRRPYVAVWVEDADGQSVRTLVLWVQTSGPGPKWIPDLKRWYRGERARKAAQGTDLIRTVSEATRKPGEYAVVWDGRNDAGDLVPPGDYTLSLEAVREHGTYQLIRKTISCRDQPVRVTLEGNEELKSATLEYRKRRAPARSS
jgi:thiamine biosynthesis lipoprotein ApbE